MRAVLAVLIFSGLAPALADNLTDNLPGDVQSYVDRREACNYWPSEPADKHSMRKDEIERHVRNLHCDTLAREEAILRARYKSDAVLLDAIDQARDALPD